MSIAQFEHSKNPLFHRHFLFKHGPVSFPATANQNYPLTSNTIYSTPPRPLPRSIFSQPTFIFSKQYKCCNWKCTALSATAITLMLALLFTYVMGKPLPYFLFVLLFQPSFHQIFIYSPSFVICKLNKTSGKMNTDNLIHFSVRTIDWGLGKSCDRQAWP